MDIKDFPDLDLIAEALINQAQSILWLNGAYTTGRLYNSFRSQVIVGPNGLTVSITNTAPYARYIERGTYQRRGSDQVQEPVKRKYASVSTKPQGYPRTRGAYPWDRKGIEPIYFMNPINFKMRELNDVLSDVFSKGFEQQILKDFREELNK